MCNNSCGGCMNGGFDCWWIIFIFIIWICCCGGSFGGFGCGCGNNGCGNNGCGNNSCECC